MLIRNFLFILVLWMNSYGLMGQKVKNLFRSDSLLHIYIEFDRKEVINDTEERESRPANLYYTEDDGTKIAHNIGIKVRGNSRTFKELCSFPPLQLNFDKDKTTDGIFKGQNKLKLVTHCKNVKSYESNVQEEYLVYKLYQKISPYSFKVHMVKVTYTDTKHPDKSDTQYGFLIEHIKDVAKRNNMKVFGDTLRNQEVISKKDLDKLIFFQYMIGNHDWSISKQHNMKIIIGDQARLPIAVPYDFDYCGLVNTPYAVPPKEMNIKDVKTRYFRGFCRADGYQSTIDFYLNIEQDIYTEIESNNYLTDKSKSSLVKYINGFYEDLNNPKFVDKKIIRACKVKHKHAYENG